jgi:hypothetical protein
VLLEQQRKVAVWQDILDVLCQQRATTMLNTLPANAAPPARTMISI